MNTLRRFPILATSSMLFARSLEDHYLILRKLFTLPDDKILDIGCGDGSFSRAVGGTGIDIETDLSELSDFPFADYNTLHFSESLGYIGIVAAVELIKKTGARKIIVKDFISLAPVKVPYFDYDFTAVSTLIPILVTLGYKLDVVPFTPNRERWKELLAQCGLQYHSAPQIHNIVLCAEKISRRTV